ncbi:hypothetical protein A8C32_07315 [Flavivirga aquatica]|uniref:Sulfatase N-terminal domain-containing protein n=1 Tax=Flavivirga aquatica TaxID=1849968 RepID=A0A1E5SIP4_9FLAO|nr:phosphoethanolamine transferase [Flavivirga aquatica]OEJ98983.1 hypothetical protein A8C32_07315 [Flavivirga aquatica]
MRIDKVFLRYLILIIVAFIFECIFNQIALNIIYNLIENIFFAITLICPLYLFTNNNNKRFSIYYFAFSFLIFSISIYFETVYYYLFKTPFSASAIFVALDSNLEETKEFIDFYVDIPISLFTFLIFVITSIVIFRINKISLINTVVKNINRFKVMGLLIGILIFLKFSKLIVFNVPYLMVKSNIEYYIESKKLGDYKENKNGDFHNIYKRPSKEEQEVFVIIVGESTSRTHLGLYNYYRETTPELIKRKEELLIYKDVISPHAFTVGALTKILTLGNYENPEKISEGSIIQLINSVGYETYWLSNQRPIGPYESMITKISLSAKNYKFLTTTIAGNSKVLDGELLNEFNEVINNDVKKKVIFIHLMGTHHHYKNRYPEEFNQFHEEPVTDFRSEENFTKINHYDNAILYNDFLVSSVIKKLDSLNTKSFALYFSDHGEEMFDDINMAGHNEDIYSQKMFEIPFFVWQSKKYKKEKKIPFVEDRKYMIDDLFHSIADLLDIKANEVEYTRSIFNEHFKERKRVVKDTVNYDTFFN